MSVGDFHLKHLVACALAGEPRGTDARMLELLEPYLGPPGPGVHAARVGRARPPRHGPRRPIQPIADR